MAIAKTRTQLSLDRYARIMGISPIMFHGGSPINLISGAILFPMDNAQNDVWPQYGWQNFDMVSREDLASQIALAEQEIGDFMGYDFTPRFIESERHSLPTHYRPELGFSAMEFGVSGLSISIPTDRKHFICGGRRAVTALSLRSSVTYSDPDGDGWKELATISVAIPATITDLSEVKVYFSGFSGDPSYEIRDFKTKTYVAPDLTFTFNAWDMVEPSLYEAFPTSNGGGGVDMSLIANFVTTVEIYREYVDTTKDHVRFNDTDPSTGSITETGGFIYRMMDDGSVIPTPGSYDAVNGWQASTTTCMSPQYTDLWYYAGMRNRPGRHPYSDDYLPDDVATAIAYMATARLEKVFYANNNATALAVSLREEMNQGQPGTFRMTPGDVIQNPFGPRRGEWLAWRSLYRYKQLRRTGGAL